MKNIKMKKWKWIGLLGSFAILAPVVAATAVACANTDNGFNNEIATQVSKEIIKLTAKNNTSVDGNINIAHNSDLNILSPSEFLASSYNSGTWSNLQFAIRQYINEKINNVMINSQNIYFYPYQFSFTNARVGPQPGTLSVDLTYNYTGLSSQSIIIGGFINSPMTLLQKKINNALLQASIYPESSLWNILTGDLNEGLQQFDFTSKNGTINQPIVQPVQTFLQNYLNLYASNIFDNYQNVYNLKVLAVFPVYDSSSAKLNIIAYLNNSVDKYRTMNLNGVDLTLPNLISLTLPNIPQNLFNHLAPNVLNIMTASANSFLNALANLYLWNQAQTSNPFTDPIIAYSWMWTAFGKYLNTDRSNRYFPNQEFNNFYLSMQNWINEKNNNYIQNGRYFSQSTFPSFITNFQNLAKNIPGYLNAIFSNNNEKSLHPQIPSSNQVSLTGALTKDWTSLETYNSYYNLTQNQIKNFVPFYISQGSFAAPSTPVKSVNIFYVNKLQGLNIDFNGLKFSFPQISYITYTTQSSSNNTWSMQLPNGFATLFNYLEPALYSSLKTDYFLNIPFWWSAIFKILA